MSSTVLKNWTSLAKPLNGSPDVWWGSAPRLQWVSGPSDFASDLRVAANEGIPR